MSKIPGDKVLPILLFGMLAIIAAYALIAIFKNKNNAKPRPSSDVQLKKDETPTTSLKSSGPVKTYTMEEVAAHGADPDSEECWTIIHGKVYDILEFASNSHPGGELIFQACGKDATTLFETRPMGSKTPHSENARKILEKFYIGDLK